LPGLPQVAGIHREQNIGRRIHALRLQALHQRAFFIRDELDLHTAFLGVSIEQRLDELLVARGINDDFFGCPGWRGLVMNPIMASENENILSNFI